MARTRLCACADTLHAVADIVGLVLIVLWLFMCCCTNVCVPVRKLGIAEQELRREHAWRISCPVLATMYCSGMLHPDSRGCVSWQHLWCALRAIGCTRINALFQAVGIAAYRHGDPNQLERARGGVFRYLNIFRMGVGELSSQNHVHVQHGCSTTIRDARFDPATDFSPGSRLCDTMHSTPEAAARILASRSARFDEWIADAPGVTSLNTSKGTGEPGVTSLNTSKGTGEPGVTLSKGHGEHASDRRMYLPDGLAQLLTNIRAWGDESGEWSLPAIFAAKPAVAKMGHAKELHEWQAVFAMTAMGLAFGEVDSEGQQYISLAALRSLYLQSELPSGWAPRPWGFFNGLRMVARLSETPKNVTMLRPTAASTVAAPLPTPKVAEANELKSVTDACGTPPPLSFSLAVKQSVMDAPGASATDTELRVALRMVKLLNKLGFFADAEQKPGDNHPVADDSVHVTVLGP